MPTCAQIGHIGAGGDATDDLSLPERSALAECEAVIKRAMESWLEVGRAMRRIRNERLYRAEFATFQEYCGLRWQMSKSHANRMIDAAEVAKNLTPIGATPASESLLRPLTKLTPAQQIEAWEKAAETAAKPGKPTAKEVQAAAEAVAPQERRGDAKPAAPLESNARGRGGPASWLAAAVGRFLRSLIRRLSSCFGRNCREQRQCRLPLTVDLYEQLKHEQEMLGMEAA